MIRGNELYLQGPWSESICSGMPSKYVKHISRAGPLIWINMCGNVLRICNAYSWRRALDQDLDLDRWARMLSEHVKHISRAGPLIRINMCENALKICDAFSWSRALDLDRWAIMLSEYIKHISRAGPLIRINMCEYALRIWKANSTRRALLIWVQCAFRKREMWGHLTPVNRIRYRGSPWKP
jgi:hypothetical protein